MNAINRTDKELIQWSDKKNKERHKNTFLSFQKTKINRFKLISKVSDRAESVNVRAKD